jgi:hypothetical protein
MRRQVGQASFRPANPPDGSAILPPHQQARRTALASSKISTFPPKQLKTCGNEPRDPKVSPKIMSIDSQK